LLRSFVVCGLLWLSLLLARERSRAEAPVGRRALPERVVSTF